MKTIIIYRSFLGTTKRYAEWLREEVEADIFKHSKINRQHILDSNIVIICTGTYAGWISLKGFLKKQWNILADKEVVLLVVGAASPEDPQSIMAYERIPKEIQDNIRYFKVFGTMGSRDLDKVKKENLTPVIEYIKNLSN